MLNNPKVRTVLGIVLAVVLSIVFIVEMRIGFGMLKTRINSETEQLTQISYNIGSARVSIDEIFYWPDAPLPTEDGDVIRLANSKLRVKINGVLTDDTSGQSGQYRYSQVESKQAATFYVEDKSLQYDSYKTAYDAYLNGESTAMLDVYGVAYQPEEITCYEMDYRDFRVPMMYNAASKNYYAFVPDEGTSFLVMVCADPFVLSNDKITAHFGDPKLSPMLQHTYSDYEVVAAENSLIEALEDMLDEDEAGDFQSPYQSDGVPGTTDTYTSSSDDQLRKQLVSYKDYEWDFSGIAPGTSMTIDTTSARAVESEWVLTATTYAYQNAGLQLLNMHGTKSSTTLSISGNIMNTLSTERPYVIVVKYVDASRNLLGLDVLDNRSNKLQGNSYHEFTSTVHSTDIDLDEVHAVQFEIY